MWAVDVTSGKCDRVGVRDSHRRHSGSRVVRRVQWPVTSLVPDAVVERLSASIDIESSSLIAHVCAAARAHVDGDAGGRRDAGARIPVVSYSGEPENRNGYLSVWCPPRYSHRYHL